MTQWGRENTSRAPLTPGRAHQYHQGDTMTDEARLRQEFEAFLRTRRELAETPPRAGATVTELWLDPGCQAWVAKRPDARVMRTCIGCALLVETSLGLFSGVPWDAIDFRLLDEVRDKLAVMPRRRGNKNKPLSAAYRNRVFNAVQSMFEWHRERKSIERNPLKDYGREDESDSERQGWFTETQFQEYVKYAYNLLYRDMAILSYRCGGMRNSELRHLRKSNINWELKAIVIRAHQHKTRKAKVVPLTDDVIEMLKARCHLSPSEWVFPNPRDPSIPIPANTFNEWATKTAEKSGVDLLGEKPVPHHLRHTYAVQTLIKGAPANHVADAMGIESLKTLRRYSRMAGAAIDSYREIIERRLVLPGERKPPDTK